MRTTYKYMHILVYKMHAKIKLSTKINNSHIRGVIRKFAEKCYYIALLLSIAMKIHSYKLPFITSWLKLKFRKCDVRRMSMRRPCDVTSLEPLGCITEIKLVVVFELICILMESNFLSFLEHNMRFLCYFPALCIHNDRFHYEGQA